MGGGYRHGIRFRMTVGDRKNDKKGTSGRLPVKIFLIV